MSAAIATSPWQDDYEARGDKFELIPGEAVHVPLMWPHWVKNGPEPSMSFSITWKSGGSMRKPTCAG